MTKKLQQQKYIKKHSFRTRDRKTWKAALWWLPSFLLLSVPVLAHKESSPSKDKADKSVLDILNSWDQREKILQKTKHITKLKEKVQAHMRVKFNDSHESKQQSIPIEQALNTFRLAASSKFQFHPKKDELIEVAALMFYVLFYELTDLGVSIYKEDIEELSYLIGKIKGKLPRTSVRARFYMEYCKQLLTYMQSNPGATLKSFVKDALRSRSVGVGAEYAAKVKSQMVSLWAIEYYGIGWQVLRVKDLDSFSRELKPKIDKIFHKQYWFFPKKVAEEYVVGCTSALVDLMNMNDVTVELKQKILLDYLIRLIEHSSFDVRYLAIEAVLAWAKKAKKSPTRDEVINRINTQYQKETESDIIKMIQMSL